MGNYNKKKKTVKIRLGSSYQCLTGTGTEYANNKQWALVVLYSRACHQNAQRLHHTSLQFYVFLLKRVDE